MADIIKIKDLKPIVKEHMLSNISLIAALCSKRYMQLVFHAGIISMLICLYVFIISSFTKTKINILFCVGIAKFTR